MFINEDEIYTYDALRKPHLEIDAMTYGIGQKMVLIQNSSNFQFQKMYKIMDRFIDLLL
jgi:hypothetical protein